MLSRAMKEFELSIEEPSAHFRLFLEDDRREKISVAAAQSIAGPESTSSAPPQTEELNRVRAGNHAFVLRRQLVIRGQ